MRSLLRETCVRFRTFSIDACKPRLERAVRFDVLEKHRVWTHPHAARTVERAIQHQWFESFAVANDSDNFVVAAFVMPISASRNVRQWSEIVHAAQCTSATAANDPKQASASIAQGAQRRAYLIREGTCGLASASQEPAQ
jgi:hypothetical protein